MIRKGDTVTFTAGTGRSWSAVAVEDPKVEIQLEGDPFPVVVYLDELSCETKPDGVTSERSDTPRVRRRKKMATATQPSEAKQLRSKARELRIPDYNNMTREDLRAAIADAEANGSGRRKTAKKAAPAKATSTKSSTKASKATAEAAEEVGSWGGAETAEAPKRRGRPAKAAPAAKTAKATKAAKAPAKATKAAKTTKATKAEPEKAKRRPGRPRVDRSSIEPGTCPFRKGTDRATVFALLKRGGVRRTLAEQLREKVTIKGEPGLNDYDKRLILTADTLQREWGYEIKKDGRGLDGKIKVVHPGQVTKSRSKS